MKEMDKSEDIEDNFPYKDIIDVKYPFPLKKERQSMFVRAGMFAPFAALTGYGDQVKETERYTDYEVFLDEDNKNLLDEKLNYIRMYLDEIIVSVVTSVEILRCNLCDRFNRTCDIDSYRMLLIQTHQHIEHNSPRR